MNYKKKNIIDKPTPWRYNYSFFKISFYTSTANNLSIHLHRRNWHHPLSPLWGSDLIYHQECSLPKVPGERPPSLITWAQLPQQGLAPSSRWLTGVPAQ